MRKPRGGERRSRASVRAYRLCRRSRCRRISKIHSRVRGRCEPIPPILSFCRVHFCSPPYIMLCIFVLLNRTLTLLCNVVFPNRDYDFDRRSEFAIKFFIKSFRGVGAFSKAPTRTPRSSITATSKAGTTIEIQYRPAVGRYCIYSRTNRR